MAEIDTASDDRARLPPEVVSDLGHIISQLGSASGLAQLLSLKRQFIKTLGRYSADKYRDVPHVWHPFRREYYKRKMELANCPETLDYQEIIAEPWNPRHENY